MRSIAVGIAFVGFAALPCAAVEDEIALLRQRQRAEEQAQTLAEELVAVVLDTQLRLLEENGLKALPIYRDIASMRGNIASLAKEELPAVVEMLAAAQSAPSAKRTEMTNSAREKIRDLLSRLIAERQRLYRRMKTVQLSSEARKLIELLTKIEEQVRTLNERGPEEKERAALAAIEDQADANQLYYQLTLSLADVSTWEGTAARAASDGLRVLKVMHVEQELKRAAAALAAAEFGNAAHSQMMALKGLNALLDGLEEVTGGADANREGAIHLVRELIERQNSLRTETRKSDTTGTAIQALVDEQSRLHKGISGLTTVLARFSATASLIEQAKKAAFEATGSLFEENRSQALESQGLVISQLTEIETILRRSGRAGERDKSAADLAEEIRRLEQLFSKVAKARETVATERSLSLADADQLGPFSASIAARLADVKEKLSPHNGAGAGVEPAIRSLGAEVAAELANTRRRHKAIEIGELARAAEALERAAAAEEEIARQLTASKNSGALSSEQLSSLFHENGEAAAAAERIRAGVGDMAGVAAKFIDDAGPHLEMVNRLLDQPRTNDRLDLDSIRVCTSAASKAAELLVSAAAELRRQQRQAAVELVSIADDQLKNVADLRAAIEREIDTASTNQGEALLKLEEARRAVADAFIDQLEAAGRGAQASAAKHKRQLEYLQAAQEAAISAAAEWTSGNATNPLDAAYEQQAVADLASELATQVPEPINRLLSQVAAAAKNAARETLSGSAPKADRARQHIGQILAELLGIAKKSEMEAAGPATGPLDAIAQNRVSERSMKAKRLVGESKVRTAFLNNVLLSLTNAAEKSAVAVKNLEAGDQESAMAVQVLITQLLEKASREIEELLKSLAGEQRELFRQQAQQIAALRDRASGVDPAATADLTQALHSAQTGTDATGPTRMEQSQREIAIKTTQASANLAIRSEELSHDRDLARLLSQLADQQQFARDSIATAAEQLRQLAPDESPAAAMVPAQSLLQAQQHFAQAQSATGAGAAEISGQEQVANQPIRDGLEIASRLRQAGEKTQGTGDRRQGTEEGQRAKERRQDADGGQRKVERGEERAENSQSSSPISGNDAATTELGTGFVPASPEITAKQIAGPEANAVAEKIAAAMKGKGKGEGKGKGKGEGESETPGEGTPSATAKKGGGSKSDKTAKNEKTPPGELEKGELEKSDSRGKTGGEDAVVAGKGVDGEAWFAKLPSSVQAAIQAKSRGKAPRGYEERLRRYFNGAN